MPKKLSVQQLMEMAKDGASVESVSRPDYLDELARSMSRMAEREPKTTVAVDMRPVSEGMASMAATMAYMQEWQQNISERLVTELEKINVRTKAKVTVTRRNADGGIETAEIEIIE